MRKVLLIACFFLWVPVVYAQQDQSQEDQGRGAPGGIGQEAHSFRVPWKATTVATRAGTTRAAWPVVSARKTTGVMRFR